MIIEKINKYKNTMAYKSIVITIFTMFITIGGLLNYVSSELAGNMDWMIMPSSYFGVPEALEDKIEPLCENGSLGWDGQFYYYMANDILGSNDTAEHIDSPSYRYQRIGLPLLAAIIAYLTGQEMVTVELFTGVYIFLLTIATYVFARYLEKKNHSVLWVLPWILSVGVQITLRHALPDAAADAFMIFAIILLLERKYIGYAVAIMLASLCREANIAIAAMIFLFGFFGVLDKEKKFNIKHALILAFPGIVFVLWYLYVTIHFGAFPFSQAYGITEFFMMGFVEFFLDALKNGKIYESVGLLVYATTVITALCLEVSYGKKNPVWFALIPFTILLGSFGSTVMSHYSGYLKGISSLLFFIPLMLLENNDDFVQKKYKKKQTFISFLLIFALLTGGFTIPNHATGLLSSKYGTAEKNETAQALINFNSHVDINECYGAKWVNMPYTSLFGTHEDYTVYNVHIENLSDEMWSCAPNSDGRNAVYISYHWFKNNDMNTVVKDGIRNKLGKNIYPGECADVDMYVELPKEPGQYVLRITLLQEGVAWFYHLGGGYVDINYVIQ